MFLRALLCSVVCIPILGHADLHSIVATDRGWYDSVGLHSPENDNYIAGRNSPGSFYRNWFVFDLRGLPPGAINSATLSLFNPPTIGFRSPNPSETFSVGSVGTSIVSLTNGSGGVSAYDDLAAGALWGTRIVSSADNGSNVLISLNGEFTTAVAPLLGSGIFAIGGYLSGDTSFTTTTQIFGGSDGLWSETRLLLDIVVVPEPQTCGLVLLGGVCLLVSRRRHNPQR